MNKDKLEPKRRRVTRACDTCRQKKVKCDGKQPCIHCTVYSYSCTYDQPNIRNKKNSGIPQPSYPRVIIAKNSQITSTDTNKNANNLIMFQNIMDMLFPKLKVNVLDDQPMNFDFEKFQKKISYLQNKYSSNNINIGELMDNYLDGSNFQNSPISPKGIDSTTSDENMIGREIKVDLPTKDIALQLIHSCWDKACVLFRFYHRPSLLDEVDLLYSLDPLHYTDRQQKFLPFFYSVLAVGSLFSRSLDNATDNEILKDDGYKYFLEARKLIDITDVGDIISIQTIVMMILYLQCSARLSTCYSYIGIGLRSALKEGLHRNLSVFQDTKRKLNPIEIDTRKRLFYTIYKMDVYINSLLGLPKSLSEDEFDQTLPEDLDDENITRTSYNHEAQKGKLSSAGCANHHTKLMFVMSHIVRDLYPIKSKNPDTRQTPDHMHKKVSALELELKNWLDQLPKELKPSDPNNFNQIAKSSSEKFILANYYLHLAFLNCQIMLYRPFIHFISHGNEERAPDPRSLIRGRNCIKVARLVVKLANKMIDQNLLAGTYWFSMYTIFFSIACLIYYYHFVNNSAEMTSGSNYAGVLFDDDLNIDMIKHDIEIGQKVLDNLKGDSHSSMRIYNILNNLFEQLNRRTAITSKGISDLLENTPRSNLNTSQIKSTVSNFEIINKFNDQFNSNNSSNDISLQESNSLFSQDFSNEIKQLNLSQSQNHLNQTENTNPALDSYNAYPLRSTQSDNYGGNFNVDPLTSFTMPPNQANTTNQPTIPQTSQLANATNFKLESPNIRSISEVSNSSDDQNQQYLPGVMDKLDAEVFGKMLPPYMMGQDENRRESFNFDNISDLIDASMGKNLDYDFNQN
ncbi:activator of stress genes 1 [[Candida] jaroonii]|uniref:Activator of stress genes 1 n=1 Tax=[Candida] jaroonii TaxID=467808 RepID=A0ACA9Y416_9ASCO|nr:activator of stress genes 1 [[Candida] jaroonii]